MNKINCSTSIASTLLVIKRITLLLIVILLSFNSVLFAQESVSKWQTQPILIDGDAADWVTNPRFFDSESNVMYELRNDGQNVYLILKSTDKTTQAQLTRAGFSIRLKVKSKPPTKFSINFLAPKMPGMPPMGTAQNRKKDGLVDKLSEKPEFAIKDTATLEGFILSKGVATSENADIKGIYFAKNKPNSEQTTIEIQIPIREIFSTDLLADISLTPIQVQIQINELKGGKNSRGGMRGRPGMHGGGDMGGPGGGGMGPDGDMGGGEMGGGDMSERPDNRGEEPQESSSTSKKTFSTTFRLSTGK